MSEFPPVLDDVVAALSLDGVAVPLHLTVARPDITKWSCRGVTIDGWTYAVDLSLILTGRAKAELDAEVDED